MCQVILTISEPVPPSENTSSAIYSDITEKAEPVPLSKNTSSAIYSDNMEKAEPVPLSKTHHQRYTPIAQKKRNQFRFPKNIISDILRQHRKSGTSSAFRKHIISDILQQHRKSGTSSAFQNTSSAIYSDSTEKAEPVPIVTDTSTVFISSQK